MRNFFFFLRIENSWFLYALKIKYFNNLLSFPAHKIRAAFTILLFSNVEGFEGKTEVCSASDTRDNGLLKKYQEDKDHKKHRIFLSFCKKAYSMRIKR